MSTVNLVTEIQAVVTDLGTAKTDIEGFIGVATASGLPGSADDPSSTQVAQAKALLAAVTTALEYLDDVRFQSGSALDASVTIS